MGGVEDVLGVHYKQRDNWRLDRHRDNQAAIHTVQLCSVSFESQISF